MNDPARLSDQSEVEDVDASSDGDSVSGFSDIGVMGTLPGRTLAASCRWRLNAAFHDFRRRSGLR